MVGYKISSKIEMAPKQLAHYNMTFFEQTMTFDHSIPSSILEGLVRLIILFDGTILAEYELVIRLLFFKPYR
jgi:hypothetical protein